LGNNYTKNKYRSYTYERVFPSFEKLFAMLSMGYDGNNKKYHSDAIPDE